LSEIVTLSVGGVASSGLVGTVGGVNSRD
jgi:hypothetical protein